MIKFAKGQTGLRFQHPENNTNFQGLLHKILTNLIQYTIHYILLSLWIYMVNII